MSQDSSEELVKGLAKMFPSEVFDFFDETKIDEHFHSIVNCLRNGHDHRTIDKFVASLNLSKSAQKKKLNKQLQKLSIKFKRLSFLLKKNLLSKIDPNDKRETFNRDEFLIFIHGHPVNKKQVQAVIREKCGLDSKTVVNLFKDINSNYSEQTLQKEISSKLTDSFKGKKQDEIQKIKTVITEWTTSRKVFIKKLPSIVKEKKFKTEMNQKVLKFLTNFDEDPENESNFYERVEKVLEKQKLSNYNDLQKEGYKRNLIQAFFNFTNGFKAREIQEKIKEEVPSFQSTNYKELFELIYPLQFYNLQEILEQQTETNTKKDAKISKLKNKNRKGSEDEPPQIQVSEESLSNQNRREQDLEYITERKTVKNDSKNNKNKGSYEELKNFFQTNGCETETGEKELKIEIQKLLTQKKYNQIQKNLDNFDFEGKSKDKQTYINIIKAIFQKYSEDCISNLQQHVKFEENDETKLTIGEELYKKLNDEEIKKLYAVLYENQKKSPNVKLEAKISRLIKQWPEFRQKIINKRSKQARSLFLKFVESFEQQKQDQIKRFLDVLYHTLPLSSDTTGFKMIKFLRGSLYSRQSSRSQSQNEDHSSNQAEFIQPREEYNIFQTKLTAEILQKIDSIENIKIPRIRDPESFEDMDIQWSQKPEFEKNSQQIKKLVEYLDNGIQASKKTLGKCVVFVLGKTGVGKSTLIHFLNGVEIRNVAKKIFQDGIVPRPVLEFSHQLEGFKVSGGGSSETKRINVCQVEDLIIADSAGFSDTSGCVFDLANTVSLEKAMHNAKSVRLIILIDQATILSDARGGPILKLATEITGYLKTEDIESFIRSITVIISKVDKPASNFVSELKKILSSQRQTPTIFDKKIKTKVQKFIEALILGVELQESQYQVDIINKQIQIIKDEISKDRKKIEQSNIKTYSEGIQFREQQIKISNQQINSLQNNSNLQKSETKQKIENFHFRIQELNLQIKSLNDKIVFQYNKLKPIQESIKASQEKLQKKLKELQSKEKQLRLNRKEAKLEKVSFNQLFLYYAQKLCRKQQRQQLLNSLRKCPKIQNPQKNIQMSVHNESKTKAEIMVKNILLSLHDVLNKKLYKVAELKLDEIVYLNSHINTEVINKYKLQCQNQIHESIGKNCKDFTDTLNEGAGEKGQFSEQGIKLMKDNLRNMENANSLIQKIPNLNIQEYSPNGLYLKLEQKFKFLIKYTLTALRTCKSDNTFMRKAKSSTEKLEILYLSFGIKVPKVKQLYEKFVKDMFQIFIEHVKKVKQSITSGDYYSLTESLTFIQQFSNVIHERFFFDSEKIYTTLIQLVLGSLQYRSYEGLKILIPKLTTKTAYKVRQCFQAISLLGKDIDFVRHLKQDQFKAITSKCEQFIQNQIKQHFKNATMYLNKNRFTELREEVTLVCELRKINDSIAAKTSLQYSNCIVRLENDLTNNLIKTINDVVKNVQLGVATDNELFDLKTSFDKISKLTWLESLIGGQSIKQLLQINFKVLKSHATKIKLETKNIFYSDLDKSQDEELCYQEGFFGDGEVSGFSSSYKKRLNYLNRGRSAKFSNLNSSIKFLSKICEISTGLNECFNEAKRSIEELVKQQISNFELAFTKGQQNFTLHRIQLQRHLIRLTAMKEIELDVKHDVERCLKDTYLRLQNYYQTCLNKMKNTDYSDFQRIEKCVTTCSKLFRSLTSCQGLLIKRGINNGQEKSQMLKVLNIKFQQVFDSINQDIDKDNFVDAEKSLKNLKKYRNSDLNSFLTKDKINYEYAKLSKSYNQKIDQVPQDIEKLFSGNQFDQLVSVFINYQKNGKVVEKNKILNRIKNAIQIQGDSILIDISNLQFCQKSSYSIINSKIQKFLKYKDIQQILPSTSSFRDKKDLISQSLKDVYKTITDSTIGCIEKHFFGEIYKKIDYINGFHDIILKNITDPEFKIEKIDMKAKFEASIKKIMDLKFDRQWNTYFSIIYQLGLLDKQKDSEEKYELKYKNNLKAHIQRLCHEIKDSLNLQMKTEEFDQVHSKLKTLRNQTSQYIKDNPEFNQFLDQYEKIEKRILQFSKLQYSNAKYSSDYLNRIKYSNQDQYLDLIRELKIEYDVVCVKIQDGKKCKNYQGLSKAFNDLQKFKDLKEKAHLKCSQGKSPSDLQLLITKEMSTNCNAQKKAIQSQLNDRNVENSADFSNLKDFFQMLIKFDFDKQKDSILVQDIKQIHVKIVQCLNEIIPKTNSESNINQFNSRHDNLVKYEHFINLLKNHLNEISSSNKTQAYNIYCDYRVFAFTIRSNESPKDYEKKLQEKIKNLPSTLQKYFINDQFKKIHETLIDVKNTKTKESLNFYNNLSAFIRSLIQEIGKDIINRVHYENFEGVNQKIYKIQKAQEVFKSIQGLLPPETVYSQVFNQLREKIKTDLVETAKRKISDPRQIQEAFVDIIEIKRWVNRLPILEEICHEYLDQIFSEAQRCRNVGRVVQELERVRPQQEIVTFCNEILHAHRDRLAIPRLMPKMTMQIEDCIANFKGEAEDSIDKEQLLVVYNIYIKEFKSLIQTYVSGSNKESIPQNLEIIKRKVTETLNKIGLSLNFGEDFKSNAPILLAQLFAYMSVMKSAEPFYNARQSSENSERASEFLLQPHPIQVLAILRFIGCDNKTTLLEKWLRGFINFSKLDNHLMQIKTGEGKSIILGAMSLIFSLLGSEVYCVCYSRYLSERDETYFKEMFREFNVVDKIKYGTFSQISEMIINEEGDIRALTNDLFSNGKNPYKIDKISKEKKSNRILLVDEVDTFFSKDFYGNTYNPCVFLLNDDIAAIIQFICDHRNENSNQIETLMKATSHYKNISEEYKDCIEKINGQLKIMISDVKNFKSRDYVVEKPSETDEKKIGYKEQDGISFNSVYGYETMFLYMYEHSLGNITKQTLNKSIGINLSCGKFSYADMIDKFEKIFGVSGTLQNLNAFESKILQRYKIKSKTFAPSVYGESNRTEKSILIEDGQGRYFQTIASSILESLRNKGSVMVFFENQVELKKFSQSPYTEHFKKNMNVVTEKTISRDFFIKKATSSETVTLFTAPFGRGTDFIVFSPIVKERGVDVIQVFLSQELSQEIQIKGRTARQGAKGTYQLILELGALNEKFKITKEMIQKATQNPDDSVGKLLQRQRQEFCKEENEKRQKYLEDSKGAHQNSLAKRKLMIERKIKRDDAFFYETVSGSASEKARIGIVIDSTGSMKNTIQAVKGKVMRMIEKLAKQYPNQFEIQIMFYYGFDAYDKQTRPYSWGTTNKLHFSPWSSDVNVLSNFLRSSGARGGSDHEAIEVALHHLVKCNEEVGMKKAILIGDAGLEGKLNSSLVYNVHPDDQHRYSAGEDKKMTLVFSSLLTQLNLKGVQVDTYPIGKYQQIDVTCKQISDTTKGQMTPFNPDTDDLATQIESVITECIKMKR